MLRFSKYHGLGNDFVIVDLRSFRNLSPSPEDPAIVQAVCDRNYGVGADGVLALLPPKTGGAVAAMRVLNADGGEAEMCGNGLRCVARHLYERDPAAAQKSVTIDTGAGPLACEISDDLQSVTVNMGAAHLSRGEIPMIGPPGERCVSTRRSLVGRDFEITAVSMGNPHAICFVDESGPDLRKLAEAYGPALEQSEWFPQRTNAEFARSISPTEIELVVWERGCGITLACGTGACATAVAACLTGRAETATEITINLLGGDLAIRVAPDLSAVFMRGPAKHVYDAEIDLAAL